MRYLGIGLIVIILGSCSKLPDEQLESTILVKRLKEVTYPSRSGNVLSVQKTTFTYNSQNKLERKSDFDGNDSLKSFYTYTYHEDTIRANYYRFDTLESYSISYKYFSRIRKKDQYGKTRLKPGVSPFEITFLGYTLIYFDECERPTRKENYSWTAHITGYETLSYSNDDRSVVWKEFDTDGNLILKNEVLKSDIVSELNTFNNNRCYIRCSQEIDSYDYRNNPDGDLTQFTYEYETDQDNYPTFIKFINVTDGSETTRRLTYY